MIVDTSNPLEYHNNYRSDAVSIWHNGMHLRTIPAGEPRLIVHFCRFALSGVYAETRARHMIENMSIQDGDPLLLIGGSFGWIAEQLKIKLPSSEIVVTDTSPWVQAVKDFGDADEISTWLQNEATYRGGGKGTPYQWKPGEFDLWMDRIKCVSRSTQDILDEDSSSNRSRKNILDRISGNQFAFAITENVLPWLTDAEARGLSQAAHQMADKVVHKTATFSSALADESEPNPWNWKWPQKRYANTKTTDSLEAKSWYTNSSWGWLLPNDYIIEGGTRVLAEPNNG